MMPIRTVVFSFILLVIVRNPSFAQASPSLPEPERDVFVGTWKANADKSRPKLDKVEASYVMTISRDGDDRVISSKIKKETAPPLIKKKTYSEFDEKRYRIRCDGLLYSMPSSTVHATMSCTYKSPNQVEGQSHIECPKGTLCQFEADQYWTQEVSADGQQMTVSAYTDSARTKVKSTEVRDRVK